MKSVIAAGRRDGQVEEILSNEGAVPLYYCHMEATLPTSSIPLSVILLFCFSPKDACSRARGMRSDILVEVPHSGWSERPRSRTRQADLTRLPANSYISTHPRAFPSIYSRVVYYCSRIHCWLATSTLQWTIPPPLLLPRRRRVLPNR